MMWRLGEFQYDELIPDGEVSVLDESLSDEVVHLPRDRAIELAHARGLNLVATWPGQDAGEVWCEFGKVALPLRWETLPTPEDPPLDDRLWFEAPCGQRDLLLDSNGHTFRGRMLAWCPHQEHHVYSVSLGEMAEMSTEAEYFVRGFLAGNEPGPPLDDDGEVSSNDEAAWKMAVQRFRATGSWAARWSTCDECGCVLLPDSTSERCWSHRN